MPKIDIAAKHLEQLGLLDAETETLNKRKIAVVFDALGITPCPADLEKIMGWNLIAVAVPDRQMATQLNNLVPYVPKLIFEISDAPLFTIRPGEKKRRLRKDR